MTKTLTEQWRNGEIDDGLYYFKLPSGETTITSKWGILCYAWKDTEDKIEVLDPVPSYYEYQDIIQQNVNQESAIETYIENIKRLQEQIKEANEILKGAKHLTVKDSNGAVMFELVSPEINEYLEKWGVK